MTQKTNKDWDGKSRGSRFGYRFFVNTIRIFGIRCAYFFMSFIVLYFIPFSPRGTKAIWKYNRQRRKLGIFGSIKELYCHYFTFGQTLIDKVAIKGGLADKYNFEFDNYSRFLEILDSGRSVVLIGAHVGCWEAGAGFFGSYGKKINIVMLDAEHQQIKEVLEESSVAGKNYKIIPLNQDMIGAMFQIKEAIDSGEYICFNGDRFIADDNITAIDFLGGKAFFPTGPFKIAVRCGVPIVFYYSMRGPGRTYRFIFEEARFDRKSRPEELLEQYARSLEGVVRKYPRQWFNFYDFWNTKRD